MNLGKGDFVECVEGYTDRLGRSLTVGALYCIEAVSSEHVDCAIHAGAQCYGVRTVSPELPKRKWWCGNRFKPVYRPNAEIIVQLKKLAGVSA